MCIFTHLLTSHDHWPLLVANLINMHRTVFIIVVLSLNESSQKCWELKFSHKRGIFHICWPCNRCRFWGVTQIRICTLPGLIIRYLYTIFGTETENIIFYYYGNFKPIYRPLWFLWKVIGIYRGLATKCHRTRFKSVVSMVSETMTTLKCTTYSGRLPQQIITCAITLEPKSLKIQCNRILLYY